MKIVYYSTEKRISKIMAFIHLGKLRLNNVNNLERIIDGFKKSKYDKILYEPLYVGTDCRNDQVYIMVVDKQKDIMFKFISDFLKMNSKNPQEFIFINADKSVGLLVRIGIFFAIDLGLKSWGYHFIRKGIDNFSMCSLTSSPG
ncbi:MAG: DUF3189 family protein [Bacillota bacterium]